MDAPLPIVMMVVVAMFLAQFFVAGLNLALVVALGIGSIGLVIGAYFTLAVLISWVVVLVHVIPQPNLPTTWVTIVFITAGPFVAAFTEMGIPYADHIMNAVVLTAVLSCLNSGMYTASRMLFVLAARREAPAQRRIHLVHWHTRFASFSSRAGQAGGAGAAQQLQQHGFGLVVAVVGK